MERVRCLLLEAKLSRSFWGEVLYTVAHMINLSPTLHCRLIFQIEFGMARMFPMIAYVCLATKLLYMGPKMRGPS